MEVSPVVSQFWQCSISCYIKIGAYHKVKTKKSEGRKLRPGKHTLLIGDTITFLVHNGKLDVTRARSLYDAYSALCQCFVHG
jgi:hypothetical protein